MTMPRAPVLLRDIQISRAPGFDDPDLRADPDLEVSPVLLAYLASAFRATLDPVLIEDLNDLVDDPDRVGEGIVRLARELAMVPDFRIDSGVLIGSFHHAKQAMHDDLVNNADLFAENDLFAAIAGDDDAISAIRRPIGEVTRDAPDQTPPSDEFLVFDADPSQSDVINAINAAVAGRNLVVQGPGVIAGLILVEPSCCWS